MEPLLFLNRNFTLVLLGQIISLFGATILKFALSLYILDLTGRADIFATILAVSTLPVIFISPIGGAIADRLNRRNLMVLFDFVNSSIVLLLIFGLQIEEGNVLFIGLVMTLLSIVSTMYQPTVQASIPVLVEEEQLIQANGFVSGIAALTGILGPVLGGILYSFVGLHAILWVSCISFFLSAIMEIFIHMPFTKRIQTGGMLVTIAEDIKEGIGYIVKEKPYILKVMFLAAGLNVFLVPLFLVGLPYMIKIAMGGSDVLFGIAQGLISFSSILGAILIGFIGKKLQLNKLYLWIILAAIFLVPMAMSVSTAFLNIGFWLPFTLFTACAVLIFLVTTIVSIFLISTIQRETPNQLLGKVMAILFAASACATPLGQLLYGILIDHFSTTLSIPIFMASAITLILAISMKKTLKNH